MSIIGLDMNVLTGWYNAKLSSSLASSSSLSGASRSGASSAADVVTPWDVRGDVSSLEEMRRSVLATGVFFKDPTREFSALDAPADHKSLFSLHQGLKRLAALAEEAKDKETDASRRTFLENRFQEGMGQLDTYFQSLDLTEVNLLKGEELRKMESEVAISRGSSTFTTGLVHSGDFDAEVASLTGDVQFDISVVKNGVTTNIAIDLADMGATTRNLDNIAEHINTQLEAAGMLTKFSRVKLGEKNEFGVVEGNDFGFKVSGISTERISFSSPTGEAAVYLTGTSGLNDTAGGQFVKLTDLASGDPTVGASSRWEADATTSEVDVVGGEDGETRTKTESNPLEIHASAASADGGIYVVGETSHTVDGQVIKGEQDLVLAKYDSLGNKLWSRVLGASENAAGTTINVDDDGNVVIAGQVSGGLGSTTDIGGTDTVVAKYNGDGVEQWMQRFGSRDDDTADSVAIGSDGTVYVAGRSESTFGDQTHLGGASDGYIRAIGSDGTTQYTRRIGGAGEDKIASLAIADDGSLLVASEEDGVGVVRKYDAADGTSAASWEQSLGDLEDGRIGQIISDGTDIYVAGSAGSSFAPSAPLSGHAGGVRDAFLVKMTDGATPSLNYTTFVGSAGDEMANAVTVSDGKVYLAGKTDGTLPGATLSGDRDAFAARVDATTGALDWATQISGRSGIAESTGIVVQSQGDSVLDAMGLPSGSLTYSDSRVITDRSAAREGDHFYISVDGGRRKKISIDADDTMRSLTFKINAHLVLDGTADVRRSSAGDQLRIKAAEDHRIELFAGETGRDLLKSLGIEPGAVVNTGSLLDDDDDKSVDAPPLFSLDLPNVLSLADEDTSEDAMDALQAAMSKVQRAYRDITTDPALKALLEGPQNGKTGGTVPAYYNAQLANYQAGLSRLAQGPSGATGALFF